MVRSSEWLMSKDPSERVSGLARYQVSHTVYQNGPSSRRSLLGRASRPFRPQSRSSKSSSAQPIQSRSALIRLEPSHRRLRPFQSGIHQNVSSAATAAGPPGFQGYGLRFGGTLEQPTTRHSLRCHQIHGEMVQRIIYRQHAVILAPYMQATPVLGPPTRFTIPPVRQFSTIVSPPPITWASSFDVCVAAVLLIGYTAHPAA
jgi:hypothetical protein